jgi:hypothetical protein
MIELLIELGSYWWLSDVIEKGGGKMLQMVERKQKLCFLLLLPD